MKLQQLTAILLTLSTLIYSQIALSGSPFQGPSRDANGNVVPTPKGEQCVEETAYMRKNHMKLLLHKRDLTMHEGIRTKTHSLVECIDCHATPDESGKIIRVFDESGKHFCATCHIATAVKLDCFECHADRPVSSFKKTQSSELFQILSGMIDSKPHAISTRSGQ